MFVLARALRTVLVALALTALLGAAVALPTTTTIAGSSGQPGDIDVGTDPLAPTTWFAGSSGQPGDIDVG